MSAPPILPRPHLLKISRDREWGVQRSRYVRLDRNEQVAALPERIRHEILAGLSADLFNAYPDPRPLYERLSRALGLGEENLFITAGSDAAIRRVFETFVAPGDAVAFADPTYPMYEIYCQLHQARAVVIPYETSRRLPVERLHDALKTRPRILALVNPAQPTGTVLAADELRRLAAAAEKAGTVFIIDEAYYPFFPETAMSWFAEFGNVIVTRTFSKAGGIAGLRLGYLATNRRLVDYIQRTRGSHEVNSVAVAVGCYLLDHPELERTRLREIEAGRAVLCAEAEKLGLLAPSSAGNFQLLSIAGPEGTPAWISALQQKGFLVKGPFRAPCLRDCIRVTLDGPEIMAAFSAALSEVAGELRPGPSPDSHVLSPPDFAPRIVAGAATAVQPVLP